MNIVMVLRSHDRIGDTGRKTSESGVVHGATQPHLHVLASRAAA
jgi:hypothetical protein